MEENRRQSGAQDAPVLSVDVNCAAPRLALHTCDWRGAHTHEEDVVVVIVVVTCKGASEQSQLDLLVRYARGSKTLVLSALVRDVHCVNMNW